MKCPAFTITADDPHFIATVQAYSAACQADVAVELGQRNDQVDEINELLSQARAYRNEKKLGKPTTDLKKRSWSK